MSSENTKKNRLEIWTLYNYDNFNILSIIQIWAIILVRASVKDFSIDL